MVADYEYEQKKMAEVESKHVVGQETHGLSDSSIPDLTDALMQRLRIQGYLAEA